MTLKNSLRALGVFSAALTAFLVCAFPAWALRVSVGAQGDSDVVTLSFDSSPPLPYAAVRTGRNEITVSLPRDVWDKEKRPDGAGGGRLVESVEAVPSGLRIRLKTEAFGFFSRPAQGGAAGQVLFFRDPIGTRWASGQGAAQAPAASPVPAKAPERPSPSPKAASVPEKARPRQEAKAVPPAQEKKAGPAALGPAQAQERPEPSPKSAASAPEKVAADSTPAPAAQKAAVRPQGKPAAGTADPQAKAVSVETPLPDAASREPRPEGPYFSVPYSVRTHLGAPEEGSPVAAQEPQIVTSDEAGPDGEVRFKAMTRGPEESKLAELAASQSGPGPTGNGHEVKMAVSDSMHPVTPREDAAAAVPMPEVPMPEVPMPEVPMPDVSGAGGSPSAEPKPSAPAAADAPAGGPKPAQLQTTEAAPAQPAAAGGKEGAAAPVAPEPSGVPAPEAAPQVGAPLSSEPVAAPEAAPQAAPGPEPATPQDVAASPAAPESAGVPPGVTTTPEREAYFNETLSSAEMQMGNGDMAGAKEALDGLLAAPDLPDALREQALYDLADVYYQLYSGDFAANYEKLTKAFQQAMYFNSKSDRIPSALLNLGQINLKVHNLPEAQAYFNVLRKQYPDDPNVPYIDYYWGEYYFNNGEFIKAAERFQALLQKHPDSPLAKEAAFLLARSLEKVGYNEQAYQIIDYMDKRWPLFYLEHPPFLKLAADVETVLKKIPQAKDHYWTYYNLNPNAEATDIVLARLGDIYMGEKDIKAAKEVYEKAVMDFGDKEGGLISKMRIAEGGIYDEPTEAIMVSVFDRPDNLKPKEIYTEIAEKHPESPLAPLALLKLGMWHAWQDQHGDALAAVQDLMDKYPESDLVPKARQLGDKVFAKAVPQLIADQNFRRVVDYWEKHTFMDDAKGRAADETRLGVAMSYYKVGEHQKALDLLRPYLGKEQVPTYSDMALSLASSIYLDDGSWTNLDALTAMARKHWQIPKRLQAQLDYGRAMALENLNQSKKSLPIWANLAADVTTDPSITANAMYYLAKSAMEKQDLKRVFAYSQEALNLLLKTKGDKAKIKECILMSIHATERSGRYEDALRWLGEFEKFFPEDDPEWAAVRYRAAQIYRKAGSVSEWKRILTEVKTKKPDSLYGRMSASALEASAIEDKVREFEPVPN